MSSAEGRQTAVRSKLELRTSGRCALARADVVAGAALRAPALPVPATDGEAASPGQAHLLAQCLARIPRHGWQGQECMH